MTQPNKGNGASRPTELFGGKSGSRSFSRGQMQPVLITGGAGFIGTNVAARFLEQGQPVLIYDNLSRPGVEDNLRWLREKYGSLVLAEIADIRDTHALCKAVKVARQIYHFAAQVAVTTSIDDPSHDFAVNAGGTLNLLEAVRTLDKPVPVLFTSTNKVYGALNDIKLKSTAKRYFPIDVNVPENGINESRPLDFHSPYGCSKGAADQYVLDYARSYGIPGVVFRMSCIYGPHQFGTEDQGWVAHFILNALKGEPISIFGNGKQVRDILYVKDLVKAMVLAHEKIDNTRGRAFNIGGGSDNTTSLIELMELIATIHGSKPRLKYSDWRQGDQRYYVSDTGRFETITGWKAQFDVQTGIRSLYEDLAVRCSNSKKRMIAVGDK